MGVYNYYYLKSLFIIIVILTKGSKYAWWRDKIIYNKIYITYKQLKNFKIIFLCIIILGFPYIAHPI